MYPPTTLGLDVVLAGSSRSGEKARRKSTPGFHPRSLFKDGTQVCIGGPRISRHSSTTKAPFERYGAIISAVLMTNEISGSILSKRHWHTNDHHLRLFNPAEFRGGGEFAGLD